MTVEDLGFENEREFHHLVASVDISTPAKMGLFKHWQLDDGTKVGLLKVIAMNLR